MVRIEEKFSIDAPPAAVWAVLSDPVRVAACLPGAEVTERQENGDYAGRVTVKVGPVMVAYRGRIRFERLDPERMEAELVGHGQDVKGKGGAEMRLASRVFALPDGGAQVAVIADIVIEGLLAQLGRGMIESVAAQMFQQFTAAVRATLAADRGAVIAAGGAATPLSAASVVARWFTGGSSGKGDG